MDIFYIILAILGLGLLIFLHELGHYFVARKVGMKVEVFSIGFGKPFYTWEINGVKWQICFLLLGGYVRIAGMEKVKGADPSKIEGGFFSKSPLDRIKVAFAGPLFNVLTALVFFIIIWLSGGRLTSFKEHTGIVGWVDKNSSLYESNIRPGDQILTYDNSKYTGYLQILESQILGRGNGNLTGYKIDYTTLQKTPFSFSIPSEEKITKAEQPLSPSFLPASYLICGKSKSDENFIMKGSPLEKARLLNNDRIIWADGRIIFSHQILDEVLNNSKALITIERNGSIFLTRIPRVKIADIRLSNEEITELIDYKNAALLKENIEDLIFIPYRVDSDGLVLDELVYIDENAEERAFIPKNNDEIALKAGDRILAIDGFRITSSSNIIEKLQKRRVSIIVQSMQPASPSSWKAADDDFIKSIDYPNIISLVKTIGINSIMVNNPNLRLLAPVEPKPLNEMIPNSDLKDERLNRLGLGIMLRDLEVVYNPSPFTLFNEAFKATWRTLVSLFGGQLSPKFLVGPVGMVQVMQHSWAMGFKEALFWLGTISINLGFINILPIPGLDGGHICFALYEKLSGRKLSLKAMEKLILPFIILIILLIIFLTYQDISRIVMRFFKP